MAPTPDYSWTGFYVGTTAGVGVSKDKADPRATGTPVTPAASWPNFPGFVNLGPNGTAPIPSTYTSTFGSGLQGVGFNDPPFLGFVVPPVNNPFGVLQNPSAVGIAGFDVGYNYQTGNLVFGLEADISGMTPRATHSNSTALNADYPDIGANGTIGSAVSTTSRATSFSASASPTYLSTLRARFGVAFDRTLLYATGGLAFGNVNSKTSASYNEANTYTDYSYAHGGCGLCQAGYSANTTNAAWAGARNETRVGFAAGAGFEHALTDNIIVKAEALYYNLGTTKTLAKGTGSFNGTFDYGYGSASTAIPVQSYTVSQKIDGFIARAGLNFKFN